MAGACVDRAVATSAYWDFHAWVFTPSSFELLLLELTQLRLITLQIASFREGTGSEFLVKLDRETTPLSDVQLRTRRLALLEGMKLELAEQAAAIRSARAQAEVATPAA